MKVEIIDNELVIKIPLTTPVPSASGKTLLVATTMETSKPISKSTVSP